MFWGEKKRNLIILTRKSFGKYNHRTIYRIFYLFFYFLTRYVLCLNEQFIKRIVNPWSKSNEIFSNQGFHTDNTAFLEMFLSFPNPQYKKSSTC